jgi:hypothetical protein
LKHVLHALADLFPGKEPAIPSGQEAVWAPDSIDIAMKRKMPVSGEKLC